MRSKVWRLASSQLGLVASWQLLGAGLTCDQVRRMQRGGHLLPLRRGVWLCSGSPDHRHHPIGAAVLAPGPSAFASRESALTLRDRLPTRSGIGLHIVSAGLIDLEGVHCHRARDLTASDITVVEGIPTVTFGRALLELIGDPDTHWTWVARLLDAGCRNFGDEALESAASALQRAGARGYHGAAKLRMLIDERKAEGPQDKFKLQRRVMRVLDGAGLGGVDEYHVIVDGRDRWIDRAWPAQHVGVEVKGFWGVHGDREPFDGDADREAGLASLGWRIIPATSRTDPSALVERVRRALAA